ncbi:MAG: 16S rRNA (cytosine(967)-C(5))-methyltransferase RsmB [Alphaproteobacteria bacterium]
MNKPDPRTAAFELLLAILDDKRPLDDALATQPGLKGMTPRDRALARLLTATVLRRMPELDAMIAPLLNRPLRGQARKVQNLLRLGAAQFIFLDTPAHAVVATTVAAAQSSGQRAYKGLINAVLRRLTREGAVRADNPAQRNTPEWLWENWLAAYGAETATAIAEAHLGEASLDITVKSDPALWAERLEAELLPTGSLRRAAGGDIRELPGFKDGAWWVQDAAAALPATLLRPAPGQAIVDLCAAPGGKTAQLAAAGADVLAVDISEKRMKQVAENLQRLQLNARLTVADAAEWEPPSPVDAVLLDAPCSGTGTIRRHPDIARLKQPGDIDRMSAIQDRLLARGADMLRPGGVLVYATCSLQPEEGPLRIEKLLAGGAPLERNPVTESEIPSLESAITAAGEVRTLPSHWAARGGIDGFFIARLRRI